MKPVENNPVLEAPVTGNSVLTTGSAPSLWLLIAVILIMILVLLVILVAIIVLIIVIAKKKKKQAEIEE